MKGPRREEEQTEPALRWAVNYTAGSACNWSMSQGRGGTTGNNIAWRVVARSSRSGGHRVGRVDAG